MIVVLKIYGIICLISAVFFAWATYKAPVMKEHINEEECLLINNPNYLGHRINK